MLLPDANSKLNKATHFALQSHFAALCLAGQVKHLFDYSAVRMQHLAPTKSVICKQLLDVEPMAEQAIRKDVFVGPIVIACGHHHAYFGGIRDIAKRAAHHPRVVVAVPAGIVGTDITYDVPLVGSALKNGTNRFGIVHTVHIRQHAVAVYQRFCYVFRQFIVGYADNVQTLCNGIESKIGNTAVA